MWFLFYFLGSSKVLIGWLKSSRHIGPHVLLYFSWGGGGLFLKYGRAVCYKVGCPDWCATSLKGLKKKFFCFCSFVSLISTVVSITVGGGIPLLSSLFWWFEGKLMRETLQHFLSKWEMFFVFFSFSLKSLSIRVQIPPPENAKRHILKTKKQRGKKKKNCRVRISTFPYPLVTACWGGIWYHAHWKCHGLLTADREI